MLLSQLILPLSKSILSLIVSSLHKSPAFLELTEAPAKFSSAAAVVVGFYEDILVGLLQRCFTFSLLLSKSAYRRSP